MRVFFSFYFTADHTRAAQVMQDFLSHPGTQATGFISPDELAEMAQAGLPAIYAWIEREVAAADVVVVLIGAETRGRHFVEFELACAQRQQKPIIGLAVHTLKDADGQTSQPGDSPLFPVYSHYDHHADDGAQHLLEWAQSALASQPATLGQLQAFLHQLNTAAHAHRAL